MGYPDWERPRDGRDRPSPETGRWDPRQEQWIPQQQRAPEQDDYRIEPFPARSDPQRRPGQGRVLDHDEWDAGNSHRPEWGVGVGVRRRYEEPLRPQRPPRRQLPPPPPPEDLDEDLDDEDDEDEPDQRSVYIGSFISTACWYLIPFAAYAGWSLTLPDDPRPGCTTAFGLPCPSAHDEALTNIGNLVPQIAVSMALSIVIAMLLGRVTTGWRPFAIGFASAVLGAGVATVGFAVLKTQI
ncbi:hypothetical protein [Dactylosporangium sp. CA-233914]|uniref:hypothetical protein n=1 Tax=Dactylosporangium sp. CA-233914 TaxID=3239934 RepID=UPI003D93D07C